MARRKVAATAGDNNDGLTTQQEAYCRARAMGMSVGEARKAAGLGISAAAAYRWEENPAVSGRISKLSELATNNAILKTGLDRQWVIGRLMSVVERCMQAEEVTDREGNPLGTYEFDSTGATRALELLGKTMRMWDGKAPQDEDAYANLTDADLARIAKELADQTGVLTHEPDPED